MLAAGGRFSMTVGENLNIKVGVEVLSEREKSALAKSLVSDVACSFLANHQKQASHKFQSSQPIQMRKEHEKKKDVKKPEVSHKFESHQSSQMRKPDEKKKEKDVKKPDFNVVK